MMTSAKYTVSWAYRDGDRVVCRTLYHSTPEPCIEAARLINNNPYSSAVEVREVDTGRQVEWAPPGIGRVLTTAKAEGR